MAGLGPRTTTQILQSPTIDIRGTGRPPQFSQSLCRKYCQARQASTPVPVSAPERNCSAPAEPQVVLLNQHRDDIAHLASMLSASGDMREQNVDLPSSPPSTSGRANSPDQPFLPGSRHRLRSTVDRRNLSTASFYGEYCDLKATQRMVSTIWDRLMVQESPAPAPGSDATSNGNQNNSFPSDNSKPSSGPQQQLDGDQVRNPEGSDTADGRPSASHTANARSTSASKRTSPTLPMGYGWSVTAASSSSGSAVAAAPTVPPQPRPSLYKRVVLYLGPEFELQLPPQAVAGATPFVTPSWANADGGFPGGTGGGAAAAACGGGPTPSWSLSEQELLESMNAPKPRRVRGCMLSTPEVVREVSFGSSAAAAAGTAVPQLTTVKRSRGRPRGRRLKDAAAATAVAAEGEKPKRRRKRGATAAAAAAAAATEENSSVQEPFSENPMAPLTTSETMTAATEAAAQEHEVSDHQNSQQGPRQHQKLSGSEQGGGGSDGGRVGNGTATERRPSQTGAAAATPTAAATAAGSSGSHSLLLHLHEQQPQAQQESPQQDPQHTHPHHHHHHQQQQLQQQQPRWQQRQQYSQSPLVMAAGGLRGIRTSAAEGTNLIGIRTPSSSSSSGSGTRGRRSSGHVHPASLEPRQLARQRDLLEALVDRRSDAVVTERIQLLSVVNRTGVTAINFVLQALGEMGHVHALSRLLTLQVALGLYNEHTYGTAFRAFHRAGRLGMALAAFEEACRSGRDLGPVACSVLLHIASQERNVKLAWQLFDQMVAHEMTLNRYSYNCMAYIASQHGALDDARLIYSMMKAEADGSGSGRPARQDCRPDSYTYSALVRAAVNAGRGDLLPALFNEMVASQRAAERAVGRPRPMAPGEGEGRLSKEVWGHFICGASRTGQPDLALRFFAAGFTELGLLPNREVYNILLAGLAKSRPLPELLRLYNEMARGCLRTIPLHVAATGGGSSGGAAAAGATWSALDPDSSSGAAAAAATAEIPPGSVRQPPLTPDHYTFNALLTAAAHHMADLPTLECIRREMARYGIGLNTFVGTSLINAYRRTPELSRVAAGTSATGDCGGSASSGASDCVIKAAEEVMSELVCTGAASSMSYTCMAAFYTMAQRPAEAVDCVRQMEARGLLADDSAWHFLVTMAQDAGQYSLARTFATLRQRQQTAWAAQRLQQQQQYRQQHQHRHMGGAAAPPALLLHGLQPEPFQDPEERAGMGKGADA